MVGARRAHFNLNALAFRPFPDTARQSPQPCRVRADIALTQGRCSGGRALCRHSVATAQGTGQGTPGRRAPFRGRPDRGGQRRMVGSRSRDGQEPVTSFRPISDENRNPPRMADLRCHGAETSFIGQKNRDI